MGVYDTVTEKYIQIKCTPDPCMHHYALGNKIPLEDGLYLGYEGWFTVKKSRVRDYGDKIYNKWGEEMYTTKILSPYNIVEKVMKKVVKEKERDN